LRIDAGKVPGGVINAEHRAEHIGADDHDRVAALADDETFPLARQEAGIDGVLFPDQRIVAAVQRADDKAGMRRISVIGRDWQNRPRHIAEVRLQIFDRCEYRCRLIIADEYPHLFSPSVEPLEDSV
jgi:hypothetical protein